MSGDKTFSSEAFNLPGLEWSDSGDEGEKKRSRMFATIFLCGVPFHVEAVRVEDWGDGTQAGTSTEGESRLDGLCEEFSAPGFQTVRLFGADYVVFITPYGR